MRHNKTNYRSNSFNNNRWLPMYSTTWKIRLIIEKYTLTPVDATFTSTLQHVGLMCSRFHTKAAIVISRWNCNVVIHDPSLALFLKHASIDGIHSVSGNDNGCHIHHLICDTVRKTFTQWCAANSLRNPHNRHGRAMKCLLWIQIRI